MRTFRSMLVTAVLMTALAISSEAAPGASSARPLESGHNFDLQGPPSRRAAMVKLLFAEIPAEWHEALFRLAFAGPSVLDAIDIPSLLTDDHKRERMRLVLTLALLRSVPPAS